MSNPHSFPHNSDPQKPTTTTTTTTSSFITSQLHKFASFLAPPPPSQQHPHSSSSTTPTMNDVSPLSSYQGLKNDLDEIGDGLKKAVTGFSKFALSLVRFDHKGGDCEKLVDVVGVTDVVVDFVREVSIRPEIWIDFPLSLQNTDFGMSRVQKDHVFTIQELVPNLATLKHKIQDFMSEQQFWMIYLVLLVPRLNEDDCRLLLSPEILQMYEVLLQKLRIKNNTTTGSGFSVDTENEKGSMVNKTKTESAGVCDNATNMTINKNRQDDACFSEVEDEEFKQTQSSRVSSASENSDWVRISGTLKANRSTYRGRRSESEGSSSDWHAVDDVDL